MQLKISNITNLTDARFFSAIGAHYFGFCFDVLNENNISISKAKEIIQWLHEPVIVGEFGVHQTKEEIEFIANQIELAEIQIPFEHSQKNDFLFDKFIVIDNLQTFDSCQSTDYFIVKIDTNLSSEISRCARNDSASTNEQLISLKQSVKNNKVFIETDFTKNNILEITETLKPYGIQISCKKEEVVGFSFVDEYVEILEIIGFS